MAQKYFVCKKCGHMAVEVKSARCPLVCCGEPMTELIPGTTDAATEKHVPVYEVNGSTVTVRVGDVAHPMLENHYITFVSLETKEGHQFKALKPGDEPKATFALTEGDEVVQVYEYCNLHGLWKA